MLMVSDEQLLDGPQYFSRAVTGHAEAVIRPEAGVTVRTHTGMNRALERDGVLNGIWVCNTSLVQFPPLVAVVRLRAHSSTVM